MCTTTATSAVPSGRSGGGWENPLPDRSALGTVSRWHSVCAECHEDEPA